ncbi:hypothetical protein [Streptomyces sp. NPDC055140]
MENGPWTAGGAISEPELVVSGPVAPANRPELLPAAQRRRPLGALLVGALAASAVWGAGLYAFGAQGPDLRATG